MVAASDLQETKTFASAEVDALTGVSQGEFISSLNQHTRRGWIQVMVAVLALPVLAVLLIQGASPRAVFLGTSYSLIAFALARFIEIRRRRFLLVYDMTPEQAEKYEDIRAVLAGLARSGSVRAVKIVGHYFDWKRHAGATQGVSFEAASLALAPPPHIVTNIQPWRLASQGLSLFFLPDRVLLRSRGKFAAFSYAELKISSGTSSFVWDEKVPYDALVTGSTWQYVRRDGGPDRRFANNRQIPIVKVALIGLETSTGLEIALQTTACSAAEALVEGHARYAQGTVQDQARGADGDCLQSESSRRALETLGLRVLPTASVLRRVYREMAQRNHPDRFAKSGVDIRTFAAERMKEINAAYEMLEPIAVADNAYDIAVSGAQDTSRDAGTPSWWRARELWAAIGATMACVALYGIAGSFSTTTSSPPQVSVRAATPPPVQSLPLEVAYLRERTLASCALRNDHSQGGGRIGQVAAGTMVEVMDSYRAWKKIRLPTGTEGWAGPVCWTRKFRNTQNAADSPETDDSAHTPKGVQNTNASGWEDPFVR